MAIEKQIIIDSSFFNDGSLEGQLSEKNKITLLEALKSNDIMLINQCNEQIIKFYNDDI